MAIQIRYRNCGTIGSQGTIHTEKEDYEPLSNRKLYFSPGNGHFNRELTIFDLKMGHFWDSNIIFDSKKQISEDHEHQRLTKRGVFVIIRS